MAFKSSVSGRYGRFTQRLCSRTHGNSHRLAHVRPSITPGTSLCARSQGTQLPTTAARVASANFAATLEKYVLPNGVVDYYEVLGVDDDAGNDEIKKAYRALAKECHPDYLGDEGHNICILLNEAYDVLSSPKRRRLYDAELEQALSDAKDDYTGKSLSHWAPSCAPSLAKNRDPAESRGVFVDELTCIGCKNCMWCAPATFRIEPDNGRSRVFGQWLNTEEELQQAIDSCPVSCIHWVQRADLPPLEYVCQRVLTERPNAGLMMSGLCSKVPDVWEETTRFLRMRQEAARLQAAAAGQRQYSAAQQEARRQAAERLWQQSSWFGGVASAFSVAFSGAFSSVAGAMSDMVNSSDDGLVGRRKRSMRWNERERMREMAQLQEVEPGYSVPPERALVPVKVYSRE